ncbi:hypothetical protein [Bdellovibrio bacteriovorus]|uniref:hypothetical protein n=1 Tax=Bdellovibrio bacteriovorus TaxID=959 RepID=UPI0035A6A364
MRILLSTLISFAFVLSSCVHSPTKVQQASFDTVVPLSERTPAAQDIDWWSATAEQVKNATCRIKYPVTTAEIESYFKKLSTEGFEPGISEISGVVLENEKPRLVLALAKLLSPARESAVIDDAPKNFQEKFKVNPSCTKALCAATKIFGKDVGPQMLFLMDRFDVNTSPYSFINADPFTASEIADVIRSFELVHPEQIPFSHNKQLTKFKRGYTRASYGEGGGTVVANAMIELFDSWSRQPSLMRQYTLYHEMAHNHADSQFTDYDRSATWLNFSNWKETKAGDFASQRQKAMQGHPFVSKYGETNPFEDFAESVTAYRFNPELLKRKSMEKYNLIKLLVHDGLEYTTEAGCKKQTLSGSYQKKIDENGGGLTKSNLDTIKTNCRQSYYQSILGHMPTSFFGSCVDYEATVIWQKENANKYPDIVPHALFNERLRLSTLHFEKVRKELIKELAPETADWILESVQSFSYRMDSSMSNNDYCDVWTNLSNKVYPGITYESNWSKNGVFVSRAYAPQPGAARGLCLELIGGFTPTAKSSLSAIRKWVKEKAVLQTQGPIAERGITRDTLLKYILDRTLR